jgi:hypothetical protein
MPTFKAREAGIYRATYQGCRDLTYTDKQTGEDETRWVWKFQEVNDPLSTGEIEKLTGTSMQSQNSNAYIMAAGIVGRKLQPGDDTEAHIGELYDVVYGPNRMGTLTITSVVKVAGATTAPAPVPEVPLTALPNQVADLP